MFNQIDKTPVQKLNMNFNDNDIYIKREDLITFSFGGNKARKALLFFRDLEKQKNDCVVTYGSSSSNHCRIVSNIAASKGLKCVIISPIETISTTFNKKMIELFGSEIVHCHLTDVNETIEAILITLKEAGFNPYFIQGGGHGNIGTSAYVDAYSEIKQFEIENDIHFDYIFHSSGTGTTQAGLVCGKILYNDDSIIVGISIARKNPYGKQIVFNSVNDYLENLDMKSINLSEINFIDDYVLGGYGDYNKEILDLMRDVLISEGISLDTTYTGKGFWGMKEYLKVNSISKKNVLFVHTGGTPLFFDDLEKLVNV